MENIQIFKNGNILKIWTFQERREKRIDIESFRAFRIKLLKAKKSIFSNSFHKKHTTRAPTADVGYVPNAKYLAHIPHQTPFDPIYQMF